jgi:spore coat-associated protein N
MKRFKVLFGQRRFQALITIAALMLAPSVVMASGASFTSTSANLGNTFTAGNLHHTNSKDPGAVLTATLMKPDDTVTGSVTLTNDGDIPGTFSLSTSDLSDVVSAPYTGKLSDVLTLTITMDGGTPVYSGPIKSVGTVAVPGGPWAAGASHTFNFSVHFPNGGTPGGPTAGDNNYKKSTMSIEFDWLEVQ